MQVTAHELTQLDNASLANLFQNAYALVRDNWAQHAYRMHLSGRVFYCSMGAIEQAGMEFDRNLVRVLIDALADQMHGAIETFNDNHAHAEVLHAWLRAGRDLGVLTAEQMAQLAARESSTPSPLAPSPFASLWSAKAKEWAMYWSAPKVTFDLDLSPYASFKPTYEMLA